MSRPNRITHEHVMHGEKKSARAALRDIPSEYLVAQISNEAVKPCCREINNLDYHLEKTDPDLAEPNKAVFTCNECGCKHVRFASATGKL